MATAVLGTAGSAVGGPIGGYVGAAVGSYIDNRYILPALFPMDDIKGPRISDLSIQSVSEGTPANVALGSGSKMAGQVIWLSPLIEHVRKERVGGKGGGGNAQKMITYSYSVDVAFAICEGEINSIKQIFANGEVIYDSDIESDNTSDLFVITTYDTVRFNSINGIKVATTSTYQVITSPNGGADLSKYRSGQSLTVSGCTNSVNNITAIVVGSDLIASTGVSRVIIQNDDAIPEAAGADIRLKQTRVLFSKKNITDITFYSGDYTQTADSTIEAYEGAGNVPAYRGVAYCVIEGLYLTEYGNQLPQLSFIVEKHTAGTTVQTAIEDILERTELTSAEYDATACSAIAFRGLNVQGLNASTSMLNQIMLIYDIVTQTTDGIIKFLPKTDLTTVIIDEDDLAADSGESQDRPLTMIEGSGADLPRLVSVEYPNYNYDYQSSSQSESRINIVGENVSRISTVVVMTPDEARDVAMRQLWTPALNRTAINLSLPPSYMGIAENDRLSIGLSEYNQTFVIRVQSVTRGANHRLEISGVREDDLTFDFTPPTDSMYSPEPLEIYSPPEIIFILLDIAPLRDLDATKTGLYYIACPFMPDARWAGSGLYDSYYDAGQYELQSSYQIPATIGTADTTLLTGSVDVWDNGNTIDITLNYGSLETLTEQEVLNGGNLLLVGKEIISFKTATVIGINQYRLSNLIRGLRNTESEVNGHVASEICVLLDKNSVGFIPVDMAWLGRSRFYKIVPVGAEIADINYQESSSEGNTLKPFAVAHAKSTSLGVSSYRLNWVRRTRAVVVPFTDAETAGVVPLLESSEKYEIDFFLGAVRMNTYTIEDATLFSYTATLQAADGYTVGQAITAKIYQISNTVGRGTVTELAVGNAF